MNYITRRNILLRLTSPDTIFVLYAGNAYLKNCLKGLLGEKSLMIVRRKSCKEKSCKKLMEWFWGAMQFLDGRIKQNQL